MTKSYSLDLRWRVVRFVESGHSRHAAAAQFDVSVSFVVKLLAAYHATGSYTAKPEGGWRYSKLDPQRDFLVRRVEEKPDITMEELARELAGRGLKINPASISRWYQRNGYRHKKNAAGIGARTLGRSRGAHGVDYKAPAAHAR